jgi:hypothetical protein
MSYSTDLLRRTAPRIPTETLCSELVADREQYALIVDVSDVGLRVQRPLGQPGDGRPDTGRPGTGRPGTGRIVQLEFGLPGVDEIIWAKGAVCFDRLWRARAAPAGAVRTSGVRVVAAAQRHLRLMRDWVFEQRRQLRSAEHPWLRRFGLG